MQSPFWGLNRKDTRFGRNTKVNISDENGRKVVTISSSSKRYMKKLRKQYEKEATYIGNIKEMVSPSGKDTYYTQTFKYEKNI